jgi:hypothetical protein
VEFNSGQSGHQPLHAESVKYNDLSPLRGFGSIERP